MELDSLLLNNESETLEFKEKVDIKTKFGKGKFIKTILSLVNSTDTNSYLVIGVEDKTKRIVGCEPIPEETLQQLFHENIRPALRIRTNTINKNKKLIQVIEIFRRHSFYTFLKSYTFEENKTQKQYRIQSVFIRKGSIIVEADADKIVEMGLKYSNVDTEITRELEVIANVLYDISDQTHRKRFFEPNSYAGKIIWMPIVSAVTSIIVFQIGLNDFSVLLTSLVISYLFSSILKIFRFIEEGFLGIVFSSLLLAVGLEFVISVIQTKTIWLQDLDFNHIQIEIVCVGIFVGMIMALIHKWFERSLT